MQRREASRNIGEQRGTTPSPEGRPGSGIRDQAVQAACVPAQQQLEGHELPKLRPRQRRGRRRKARKEAAARLRLRLRLRLPVGRAEGARQHEAEEFDDVGVRADGPKNLRLPPCRAESDNGHGRQQREQRPSLEVGARLGLRNGPRREALRRHGHLRAGAATVGRRSRGAEHRGEAAAAEGVPRGTLRDHVLGSHYPQHCACSQGAQGLQQFLFLCQFPRPRCRIILGAALGLLPGRGRLRPALEPRPLGGQLLLQGGTAHAAEGRFRYCSLHRRADALGGHPGLLGRRRLPWRRAFWLGLRRRRCVGFTGGRRACRGGRNHRAHGRCAAAATAAHGTGSAAARGDRAVGGRRRQDVQLLGNRGDTCSGASFQVSPRWHSSGGCATSHGTPPKIKRTDNALTL
mmetsp:Transcript_135319/g.432619  ORF Transcript_135319/g.432619 Transcript_135319/m.432619 type:complete len:404 (-) Transcript_135319:18-1229(-)